ncbi:DUF2029 domain-containing protein [Novosphingobium rosa]|uniref:DUF2029 domain-containing protein n=1 Tax=Novosphingobium rosa TaxID=76978 RepID=UPI000AA050D3|nr:DUF2029 domain-containing protein [Novosphingobium rosa]
MSDTPSPAARRGLTMEWCLAGLVLLVALRDVWFFLKSGYLPEPFFYESGDTWMDWFNTAWWAHDKGIYDSWASIYPPISFVILRVLGLPHCYASPAAGPEPRLCDWLGVGAIHAFYIIDVVLVAASFIKLDRRTALPRSLAVCLGMPLLYGLDRGNLILIAFPCVVLAFGPLLKGARARWLALAVAINLKVYIVATLGAQLLRRRWRWVEGAALTTLAVYALSYAILGVGTPGEIVTNIREFAKADSAAGVLDVWYPATYQPMIKLVSGQAGSFPIIVLLGSNVMEWSALILPAIVHAGQAVILLGAFAIFLRPQVVPAQRAALLGISLALITSEAGGYTPCLMLFFTFTERWEGRLRPIALTLAYLLCVPGDIVPSSVLTMSQDSFLIQRTVMVDRGIGLGMFLRPSVTILVPSLLAVHSMLLVWRDWRGPAPEPIPQPTPA